MAVPTLTLRSRPKSCEVPSRAAGGLRTAVLDYAMVAPLIASPAAATIVVSAPDHPLAPYALLLVASVFIGAAALGISRADSANVALGVIGLAATANIWLTSAFELLATCLALGCALWLPLRLLAAAPHRGSWRTATLVSALPLAVLTPYATAWIAGLAICGIVHGLIRLAGERADAL